MRILFCNIADMRFYQGIIPGIDEPKGGGSYVKREQDATESENFIQHDFILDDQLNSYCFGAFVQKSSVINLHIERIEGCKLLKKAQEVDGVLVVWCAASHIVGWYKDAIVYRQYQEETYKHEAGDEVTYYFNIEAKAENCVLLPEKARELEQWYVPHVSKKGATYGFGQANVWYAQKDEAQDFVKKIIAQINNFDGDNWACGRHMPALVGDIVTVIRGKNRDKMEFTFEMEEEGSRPPVHELALGKCVDEQFQYGGFVYTVSKIDTPKQSSEERWLPIQ